MLKYLKALQHVSISIQIILRDIVVSALKSLSCKITKNIKGPLWQCGSVVWCVCMAFCVEMQGGDRNMLERFKCF
jgi:predicted Abi (CAAX) family protease